MQNIRSALITEFGDPEYAHAFMASHTVSTISAQVYWTRKLRGWTQEMLADRSGIAQARISKIEAGDFSSLTMATLNKLAQALDVNLRLEFEPFANAVESVCGQTKKNLELPSRIDSLEALKSTVFAVQQLFGAGSILVGTRVVTGQEDAFSTSTVTTLGAPVVAGSIDIPSQRAMQP